MKKIKIVIFLFLAIFFVSCNNDEINKLKSENEKLKAKIQMLEQENNELKETAEIYWKNAIEQFNNKNYIEAKEILNKLIENFSMSNLIEKAKEKINEIESIEKEKQKQEKFKQFGIIITDVNTYFNESDSPVITFTVKNILNTKRFFGLKCDFVFEDTKEVIAQDAHLIDLGPGYKKKIKMEGYNRHIAVNKRKINIELYISDPSNNLNDCFIETFKLGSYKQVKNLNKKKKIDEKVEDYIAFFVD